MLEFPLRIDVVGDTGGVHVRTRALAFSKRGYSINTVTPRRSDIDELHEHSPAKNSNPGSAGYMFDLYRLLGDFKGDVVHIHYACSLSAWLWLISGREKPLVVSVMGGDVLFDEQGNLPLTARWMTRQVLRRADAITAKSDYLAQALMAMGIAEEKIETVIWGVDPDHFRPRQESNLRKELGLSPSQPIIFSPRILRPFYNIHLIIEALPHILAKIPDARLLISAYEADPTYAERLREQAKEMGLQDAVIFCGEISYERMPEYYSISDVVVGIPPSDGFPQTLLEAMACQTPNVVTRLKRYESLVGDKVSCVFADLTPSSIAQGVLSVLEDDAFAERLGRTGRTIVTEQANLADNVTRVEAIYWRLAALPPRPPASLWIRLGCIFILAALVLRTLFLRPSSLQNNKG